MTSWFIDPEAVAAEYASEEALRQRLLAHRELVEGPDDEVIMKERIRDASPRRFLDVGAGLGDLSVWAREEVGSSVVALDSSPRMVRLAAQAGVPAVLADMRTLPFIARSFDCVAASYVLYHVPDPEAAIAEMARVLSLEGVLLASTASDADAARRRAWARLFGEEPPAPPALSFSRENGEDLLRAGFGAVEQIDCDATLVFRDRERLVRYVRALPLAKGAAGRVPELSEPFRLPVMSTVFRASAPR
jgi:SAM-dependent methyltransferase